MIRPAPAPTKRGSFKRGRRLAERLLEAQIVDAKRYKSEMHTKRIGEQQLLALTRNSENGKMPVLLESGPEGSDVSLTLTAGGGNWSV